MGRKVLSAGDRLQRNFKRVLQSKPANFVFPENVVNQVYADRSKMSAKEKAAQTRLLKKYSADRYAKLYRETKVQYGEVEYTTREWRKIPKAERKELESEFRKWTRQEQNIRTYVPHYERDEYTGQLYDPETGEIVEDNQTYGDIAYENFVDDFLSRLQEQTPIQRVDGRRVTRRNPQIVEKSEQRKASLRNLVEREVVVSGKSAVGERIARNADTVSRYLYVVIFDSDGTSIDTAYQELVYIITQGNVSASELQDISEQEELNGVYN